jgi:hypothetical protein
MIRNAILTAGAVAGGYASLWRLGATWGATPDERRERLPGDELLPDATLVTTHAISIDASTAGQPDLGVAVHDAEVGVEQHRQGLVTAPCLGGLGGNAGVERS